MKYLIKENNWQNLVEQNLKTLPKNFIVNKLL